jgi:uncharacterized protein YndB with AHSA1/START domain
MLTTSLVIALCVATVAAIAVALALRQPGTFEYKRSISITAPPGQVFDLIADPVVFNTWNPFNDDPSINGTYSGPSRGAGARYTFESKRAGSGYTEIVEESAPSRLGVRLVMRKPIAADNRVEFRLEPDAKGTTVTWAMSGENGFAGRLMNTFINCDRMIGRQFETGLERLKARAEGATGAEAA